MPYARLRNGKIINFSNYKEHPFIADSYHHGVDLVYKHDIVAIEDRIEDLIDFEDIVKLKELPYVYQVCSLLFADDDEGRAFDTSDVTVLYTLDEKGNYLIAALRMEGGVLEPNYEDRRLG